MGAYSPAPVVDAAVEKRILAEVIEPTLAGMAAEGAPFTGFLYAGVMIDRDGAPRVLEFNVRFGDPETQPIMLRLQSDLVDLIEAALDGRVAQATARWDPRPSLGVVLAAHGYPGAVRTGDTIAGLDQPDEPDAKVFHAATRDDHGRVVTSGGRVLTACALGDDIGAARARAYRAVERIRYDGMFFRRDIAHRALARGSAG
jgi:phosphoribosylamine--glycine ligase